MRAEMKIMFRLESAVARELVYWSTSIGRSQLIVQCSLPLSRMALPRSLSLGHVLGDELYMPRPTDGDIHHNSSCCAAACFVTQGPRDVCQRRDIRETSPKGKRGRHGVGGGGGGAHRDLCYNFGATRLSWWITKFIFPAALRFPLPKPIKFLHDAEIFYLFRK